MENEKLESYKSFLRLSYDECVKTLIEKYGPVRDDYFKEASYIRFLKQEITHIRRGNYTRTEDGLYCHHVDEIKNYDLSSNETLAMTKPSFNVHRKDRLVYCDLIEHMILHALIVYETDGNYGYPGYSIYLRKHVEDWYLKERKPKFKYKYRDICYDRSYLTPRETKELLQEVDIRLEAFNLKRAERKQYFENGKREYKEQELALKKTIAEKEKLRREELGNAYRKNNPVLSKINIDCNTPRKKILDILFELKYKEMYDNKKTFRSATISRLRDDLLDELKTILENQT